MNSGPTSPVVVPDATRPPTLLAIRGPITGSRIFISGDALRIGRDEGNDLSVEDATVSRQHARIYRVRLAWMIEDLGSRHGTQVNREPLKAPRALSPNDEIQVGGCTFLFDSDLDLQNADFTDRSVYFTGHSDDTMDSTAPSAGQTLDTAAARDSLDLLLEFGQLFSDKKHPFGESLSSATRCLARLFQADVTVLLLWDSAAQTLRAASVEAKGDALVDTVAALRVYREGRPLLFSDRPGYHVPAGAPEPPTMRSLMLAPIMSEGHALGVLSVERHILDGYTLKDLRILQAIGALLGVFIELRQRADAQELKLNFLKSESPLVGQSLAFRQILDMIHRVGPTPAAVLLQGETGTGKELLAAELHRLSPAGQRGAPFVAVNCAAIPESLFESELFGHERGSFTGAVAQRRGYVEQANGGTLFLDEIGELSLAMQPKFLRFLQEHTFTRVGGTRALRSQVRIISATNRDLAEEVTAGRFREDLFHRVSVLPVPVPPLRQRREDIRPLTEHFLRLHATAIGKDIAGITDEALITLEKYDWPGNIRELSNCIERAILLCDGKVLLPRCFSMLPPRTTPRASQQDVRIPMMDDSMQTMRPLSDVEREHIQRVLKACDGNQLRAAERLGIHRNTLRKKLQEYGVEG